MTSSSNFQSQLILQVQFTNGQTESCYVQNNIRIGQSVANNIILPADGDKGEVASNHAIIQKQDNGFVVRASRREFPLLLDRNGQIESVQEILLTAGTTFLIGANQFVCTTPIQSNSSATPTGWDQLKCCPYCQSTKLPPCTQVHGQADNCLTCGKPIFVFYRSDNRLTTYVVPGIFNGWAIESYVAHGGMGIVFRARKPESAVEGDVRAIKIFLPSQDGRRIVREIEAMGRVKHSNTVRFDHVGIEAELSYMVMEWVDGETLAVIIANNRKYRSFVNYANWGRNVMRQALEGLAAVHRAGLVHRDIKPSNILVTKEGQVKIADLGIAKTIHEETSMVTMTGMAPGTVRYMSPEQLSDPNAVGPKSDIYSLGLTFYEYLTNDLPGHGTWQKIEQVNSTVPAQINEIVLTMLEKNPEQRPGCEEVVRFVDEIIDDENKNGKSHDSKPEGSDQLGIEGGGDSFSSSKWDIMGTIVGIILGFLCPIVVLRRVVDVQSVNGDQWISGEITAIIVAIIVAIVGCLIMIFGFIVIFGFVMIEESHKDVEQNGHDNKQVAQRWLKRGIMGLTGGFLIGCGYSIAGSSIIVYQTRLSPECLGPVWWAWWAE